MFPCRIDRIICRKGTSEIFLHDKSRIHVEHPGVQSSLLYRSTHELFDVDVHQMREESYGLVLTGADGHHIATLRTGVHPTLEVKAT